MSLRIDHTTIDLEMTHKVTALAATSPEMFLGVIELDLGIVEQVSRKDFPQQLLKDQAIVP